MTENRPVIYFSYQTRHCAGLFMCGRGVLISELIDSGYRYESQLQENTCFAIVNLLTTSLSEFSDALKKVRS